MRTPHKLEGKVFGRVTVVSQLEERIFKRPVIAWNCHCECGTDFIACTNALTQGRTLSCGCGMGETQKKHTDEKYIGKKFNRLTVIKRNDRDKNGKYKFTCLCECGKYTSVMLSKVISGDTKSCGCWNKEVAGNRNRTHGQWKNPDYIRALARKRHEFEKLHDYMWDYRMEILIHEMFPRCVVCGMTDLDHLERYSRHLNVDHVLPLFKNNGLRPGNATVLCTKCNLFKGVKDLSDLPAEWQHKILYSASLFEEAWYVYEESLNV